MRSSIHVELALQHESGADHKEYVNRSMAYEMRISLGGQYHLVTGLPMLAHKIACDTHRFEIELENANVGTN